MTAPRHIQMLTSGFCCLALAAFIVICSSGCSTTGRSSVAGTKFTISGVRTALDCFEVDCGRFPTTAEGLQALVKNPGVTGWRGPYWEGAFLDQWGTLLHYEVATNSMSVSCAGRDKAFVTPDDVVRRWTW